MAEDPSARSDEDETDRETRESGAEPAPASESGDGNSRETDEERGGDESPLDDEREDPPLDDDAGESPTGDAAGEVPSDDTAGESPTNDTAGEVPSDDVDGEPPTEDAAAESPSDDADDEPPTTSIEDGLEDRYPPVDEQKLAAARAELEAVTQGGGSSGPPQDVQKYARFKKVDGAAYDRVNEFLRDRTYITAREWAIARLCADFRTETGVEMTKIGENLPELVPFMTDTYTPQAVNQARHAFENKVRKSGATFLYGAMSDFFTAEELDDLMYEVTEVAKFLLEVEGVDLSVDEELEAEDRISTVMREVRRASEQLRHETTCPNCGHELPTADE